MKKWEANMPKGSAGILFRADGTTEVAMPNVRDDAYVGIKSPAGLTVAVISLFEPNNRDLLDELLKRLFSEAKADGAARGDLN